MRLKAYKLPVLRLDGSAKAYLLVSPEDSWAREYRWQLAGKGYACRRLPMVDGVPGKMVYLHREILGLASGDGLQVDHKNRDPRDNRRENLRVVTQSQNNQNARVRRIRTSRYRGVSRDNTYGAWLAQHMLDGKRHFIGRFEDEEEAGKAARAWRLAHMSHATD